ncbi:RNA polymerase I-specific transcription initiation factor RRN3 [Camponotus floridanus]|uniref:RNA polymerase I-specific transcription initiation factor RRN3 n=1 Tax=Camponotus floridanus TaxID=104421 RepID=E2A8H0_CAMFO|nr:RNA polymerase I-specific transcription initiation factor RRN3 isoform X1 [Camponotus floridanus]EFN70240.1 RNA polymerase I-specific transcription initiation factor RRN3 [Camponotus floridanus]
MSVVSSRVSSVSSIIKATGLRAQLKQCNRIQYLKLPEDIKGILCKAGSESKEYEKLIYSLKEGAIKDSDLAKFLSKARQCISLLDTRHELFVQIILRIQWTSKSAEVISVYKLFLQDLVCMQTLYIKTVINSLIHLFKSVEDNNAEHKPGEFKDKDIERLNHIHDILHKILEVIPMSSQVLLQSLASQFPYIAHGTYTHEIYIYALLQILNYAPQLRSDILSLIINRLTLLDVNIPRKEAKDDEEDDEMNDCTDETVDGDNPTTVNNDADKIKTAPLIVHTMDTCMELFLKYMHEFCFVDNALQIESLKILYIDILRAFETIILPTHASQYVQFIMFYICSFKAIVAETFTDWLWRKVIDPNVAPVIRQSAVCYIASLLATASFISNGLVKQTMSQLIIWIRNYINIQEYKQYIDDNMKSHVVFYSVCQAFFHLFIARHKEFVNSKNGMLFLQELDIPRIVTCRLNPLKICISEIVHSFADITSTYQLAYCYTIIENNERNQLPIFGMKTHLPVLISNFFPFESYTLQHSRQRIVSLFHSNVVEIDSRSIKSKE